MLSSAMAGWLTQRFCARRVVAAGDDQSGQPATEFALLARLAYAAKAATVSPYDTAVLKLNLNRIRHVGVLCGNIDIPGKRASVEYRRARRRECTKAVTILTPSFAVALCVSN